MKRVIQVTDKDRLLAAGLLSFIVALLLLGWGTAAVDSVSAAIVVGMFAAGPLVFSVSPLWRGSRIQKLLAIIFMSPSLAFFFMLAKPLRRLFYENL